VHQEGEPKARHSGQSARAFAPGPASPKKAPISQRSAGSLVALWISASAALSACSGQIGPSGDSDTAMNPGGSAGTNPSGGAPGTGGASGGTGGTAESGGAGGTKAACNPLEAPAKPRLWRLTARQYSSTVATLFSGRSGEGNRDLKAPEGVTFPFSVVNPNDRFSNQAGSLRMDDVSLRAALSAAKQTSDALMEAGRFGCGTDALEPCLRRVAGEAGALLFRRPLTDAELDQYTKVGSDAAALIGDDAGRGHMLEALLLSPAFLYRQELGDAGQQGRLDGYEMASVLSFALTDGPPDNALWSDAAAGKLGDKMTVEGHVRRLLDASNGNAVLDRFLNEYFQLAQAADVVKPESFHKPAGLIADTEALLSYVVREHTGADFLSNVLTNRTVFASKDTSPNYGEIDLQNEDPAKLQGERAGRRGILTQPSWLVAFSKAEENDPIRRGRFIQESLLCGEIPELTIEDIPELPDADITMRQKLDIHTQNPTCRGCHALMDPLGLAFQGFDHYGRVRGMEAGQPVDSSGFIVNYDNGDKSFANLDELLDILAASPRVQRCMTRHTFQFLLGQPHAEVDSCRVDAAAKAYSESGGDFASLVATILTQQAQVQHAPE